MNSTSTSKFTLDCFIISFTHMLEAVSPVRAFSVHKHHWWLIIAQETAQVSHWGGGVFYFLKHQRESRAGIIVNADCAVNAFLVEAGKGLGKRSKSLSCRQRDSHWRSKLNSLRFIQREALGQNSINHITYCQVSFVFTYIMFRKLCPFTSVVRVGLNPFSYLHSVFKRVFAVCWAEGASLRMLPYL